MCVRSAEEGLRELQERKAAGEEAALVLAEQRMDGASGVEFLFRVPRIYPMAKRLLLADPMDRETGTILPQAMTLGGSTTSTECPDWHRDPVKPISVSNPKTPSVPAGMVLRAEPHDRRIGPQSWVLTSAGAHAKTTVREPSTSTRSSRCQWTARASTCRSTSRPMRTMSSAVSQCVTWATF